MIFVITGWELDEDSYNILYCNFPVNEYVRVLYTIFNMAVYVGLNFTYVSIKNVTNSTENIYY